MVAAGTAEKAIVKLLTKNADPSPKQPLYNISPFTFAELLGASENIVPIRLLIACKALRLGRPSGIDPKRGDDGIADGRDSQRKR